MSSDRAIDDAGANITHALEDLDIRLVALRDAILTQAAITHYAATVAEAVRREDTSYIRFSESIDEALAAYRHIHEVMAKR